MIWMKAAIMTGLMLASPYLFYQIWIFVAAGLYPHEKNYVYLYLPISIAPVLWRGVAGVRVCLRSGAAISCSRSTRA